MTATLVRVDIAAPAAETATATPAQAAQRPIGQPTTETADARRAVSAKTLNPDGSDVPLGAAVTLNVGSAPAAPLVEAGFKPGPTEWRQRRCFPNGDDGPPTTEALGARHNAGATQSTGEIAWGFVRRGRPHFLPLLLSDYGCDIVARKYDAFSTDRAYANRPAGKFGPIGGLIDWCVLRLPIHVGMRQRLALVTSRLEREIAHRLASARPGPITVLSAPCGLSRDIVQAGIGLGAAVEAGRVAFHGLDIDAAGDVLPEARRRAAVAGVPVQFHRADLFAASALDQAQFDVINCIGLTAWLELAEVETLFRRFRAIAAPGASLIVDNWHWHAHSALGRDLEIHTRYHDPAAFVATLSAAGFDVTEFRTVPNGVCAVYVARAI